MAKAPTGRTAPDDRLLSPAFVIVSAATLAYFLSVGVWIPVLPLYVQGPLAGGAVGVGLTVAAFGVASVVLRPLAGRLADQRGRRLLVMLGAAVAGLSLLGHHVAPNLPVLVLLRLGTGAGEALFFVGASSVVNDLASERRRGEAISFFSLALYTGLAGGPFLGEALLAEVGFGWVWLTGGVMALSAALIAGFLPETRPPRPAAPAGVSPPLFHRAALLPGIALSASVCSLAAFLAFIPLYAVELQLGGSRLVFLLYAGIVLVVRSVGAQLPDRLGPAVAGPAALVTQASGLLVIAAWGTPATVYIGAAVFAVGQGLAFPALMLLVMRATSAHERGAAVGTFLAFFDVGFAAGGLALGWVAAASGNRAVFAVAATVTLTGLWPLAHALRRRPQPLEADSAERAA